jgi:biotin transporter BioY
MYLAFPLPLCLGIAAAFTEFRRKTHVISQAMIRGLLVWVGMGLSWLPLAWRADAISNAECAHMYCHVSGIETAVLVIYLIYGVVLVLLGSVITSLLIKHVRKESQRTPFDGP